MTNVELADRLAEAKRVAIAPPTSDKWEDMTIDEREQIIAALRRSEPAFDKLHQQITDIHATLNVIETKYDERQPSSDKVLVPREPTVEMLERGWNESRHELAGTPSARACYRAMLAAYAAAEAEAEGNR